MERPNGCNPSRRFFFCFFFNIQCSNHLIMQHQEKVRGTKYEVRSALRSLYLAHLQVDNLILTTLTADEVTS
jgi:hypothetical protein